MRKCGQIIVVITVLLGLSACYVGGFDFGGDRVRFRDSGEVEVIDYGYSDFDGVEASHVFEVDIQQGIDFSVVVTADSAVVEYLDVSLAGDRLRLSLKPGYNYNFDGAKLEADVRMPSLTSLVLSGASYAYVYGFESADGLRLDLSGASEVYGDVAVGEARFDLSGANRVELSGSCASLDVEASGSSNADLAEFYAEAVNVNASGASEAYVWTDGLLNVDASGDSDVFYKSGADLGSINSSGTSSVRER